LPALLARRRFLREAKATAQLDHPAIVTLHDFGAEDDGTLFMVMEWVRGRKSSQVLADHDVTPRDVVSVAQTVLYALEVAHAQGLVYRQEARRSGGTLSQVSIHVRVRREISTREASPFPPRRVSQGVERTAGAVARAPTPPPAGRVGGLSAPGPGRADVLPFSCSTTLQYRGRRHAERP